MGRDELRTVADDAGGVTWGRQSRAGWYPPAGRVALARSLLVGALLLACPGCVSMAGQAAGAAAEEATQPIVDESLDALSDPANREQMAELLASQELRRATANLTAGAVDGMLMSLSAQESVEAAAPELGLLAREVARQVTLGVDAALAEVSNRPAPQTGIGQILAGAEEATTTSSWLIPAALVALFLALVVVAGLLLRATTTARREREEAARREQTMAMLAATFREAEGQPWGPELQELLRQRAGGRGDGYLGEFLQRRGDAGASRHDA